MFTPGWKKEAKNVYKAGQKFLNYKRDLLKDNQIAEIQARLSDLKTAQKGWGKVAKKETAEAVRQLDNTCEHALPKKHHQSGLAENIEVIFVSLVVALGIRSYYLQPFRIPTGSMQPSLNGVICKSSDRAEWPNIFVRTSQLFLKGRGYVYKEASKNLIVPAEVVNSLSRGQMPENFIGQNSGIWKPLQTFHTVSQINFANMLVNCHGVPASDLVNNPEFNIFKVIAEKGVRLPSGAIEIPKGTVFYSGYTDSGDLILADKVSYHFRKPRRGETFIFDTRGIDTEAGMLSRSRLAAQTAATHYIKRCVGLPGDTLSIQEPNLIVNGSPGAEPCIKRVQDRKGLYAGPGYTLADSKHYPKAPMIKESDVLELKRDEKEWYHSQYAAMGDNTQNSLDSRYWGALEEFNVVAPAFISLWPITSGHWGLIK